MSISLWILIRPETSGVVLSAGDQSWPIVEGGGEGRRMGREREEKREPRDETEREGGEREREGRGRKKRKGRGKIT